MTEREIFLGALEMTTPEARAAYLQAACSQDVTLRRKVDELLKEHFSDDSLLAGPALDELRAVTVESPVPESTGQTLGRYKLLEKIGEGGFGEVWMAEQREPVKRRVALKIVKPGMDSRQVVARFEAERQALAMMDHANIARIFDAGTTDTGRPYFVMELVRGIKITDYCDQNELPTGERLSLFIRVCHAIQHAHQKGIIHRDIKPSNILVTLHDGAPVPKVIDFGIAKATQQELTDKTVFTQFQQFMGTPAYISPEQAEMSGLDIDTRADIYSLGVLLYELLVGQTPFDAKEMVQGGLDALRQMIREKEPLRPSTRLNTLQGNARTTTGKCRQTDVGRLVHQLQGDLDWIVMRCLEKDRTRRYETANGLAMDIERYLKNEPVIARPPSRLYEFQKTVRRHKVGFAATAAVIVALGIGLGFSTWTLFKEKQARERAVAAEKGEGRLRQEAQSSAALAEAEAGRAEANAVEAQEQREHALALAEENRRNLYAARIKLTAQAIDEGDVPRARALLEGLRPVKDEEDLRSLDWYYLYQLASNERLALTKVGGRVRSVSYSPDGRLLAAGSDDAIVRLWDAETHELLAELKGHTGVVAAVSFSPDGKMLASAGSDGTTRIWDVTSAKAIHLFQQETNGLAALAYSPDGSLIAVSEGGAPDGGGNPFTRYAQCSGQGRILLWNTRTHLLERILDTGSHDALSVAFAPDGRQLVAGGIHNTLTTYNVATGRRMMAQTNFPGPVFACLFLPNQELAVASWNPYEDSGRIMIFDPATLQLKRQILYAGKVTCLALAPDGKTLAAAGADRVLRLRDVATGQETGTFHGHQWEIWSVAFSPDGRTVATGGFDDVIKIWDTKSSPARQSIPTSFAFSVAYSPDGRLLACSGHTVQIYDAATGTLLRTLAGYTNGDVRITFSPDGSILAATDNSQAVHFWDVPTWKHWMPRNEDLETDASSPSGIPRFAPVTQIAFSPDSKTLAKAGWDRAIRFWEARTGKLTATIKQSANSVGFTPDGARLISGDREERVLWNLQSQNPEAREAGAGSLLRISKDGRWLAYAAGQSVSLCELPSLASVRTVHAHRELIYCLSFSHDGKILATASWDGTVKLWQVATGQELFTIPSHAGVVWSVEFSPDDGALAFGSGGGYMGRTGKLTILRCASAEKVFKQTQALTAERRQNAAAAIRTSGDSHARAGRWQEASSALSSLLELRPAEHHTYHQLAALLIQKGDVVEYRRHCRRILRRFATTTDPITAERMAKDCLILPDSGAGFQVVNRLVDVAIGADERKDAMPWFQMVRGLAEYRQGHFASARKWIQKALEQEEWKELKAQTYMALAMAEHQLHHPQAAQSALRNGNEIIDLDLATLESGDIGGFWVDWIFAHALQREARALIQGP